jgi:hypothetical protein
MLVARIGLLEKNRNEREREKGGGSGRQWGTLNFGGRGAKHYCSGFKNFRQCLEMRGMPGRKGK